MLRLEHFPSVYEMAKTVVILNPAAGSVEDLDALVKRIRDLPATEVRITKKPGAATQLAKKAVREGYKTVVAAGGDGTLNEVINGIGQDASTVSLGLIPLGTGNDFARTLALPTAVDDALALLRAGHTRVIDLVRVKSDEVRYFVNVSAGGFSGLVDERLTPEMKKTWGPLAYLRSAAAALADMRVYQTTVSIDDSESRTLGLFDVVVANGKYVAGGTQIAPEASIDDGLLDIILIPKQSPADLALLAARLALGNHLSSTAVVFRRATKINVNSEPKMPFNVDGELVGNEPAEFEILPRALQFVVAAS